MGEVSNGDSVDREMRIAILSGVSEVTRSERHQGNSGSPPLDWKRFEETDTVGDNIYKETKRC